MQNIIECKNLTHYYGKRKIFEDFSFSISKGKIIGLLGKNGVGKSTTINILMGFLEPTSGECLVYGEKSHELTPKTKAKIGLLHEGHVQYDFMTIEQIEKYYSKFFPNQWKKELYYELVSKLKVPNNQVIKKLSCGQRSQVVLGLIFAQDADLLILDDYSMGLDVGYRSLFLEYLKEYIIKYNKTLLMTTHIMQNLETILDDIIILDSQQEILQTSLDDFLNNFKQYKIVGVEGSQIKKNNDIVNIENFPEYSYVYSFSSLKEIETYLTKEKIVFNSISEINMNFEEAFIGYTGRY
ncbi:ABC transporter ATP-binding protein [Halarcobacter sp.]|uniref:ABC transporter ATP-binding protein n=1 Tax=Halarcobacter sp. TaxID=2321133 RepID=UPI002AA7D672|nr:ABC transporter ATP-binding protein [Halarcobacter sp.]